MAKFYMDNIINIYEYDLIDEKDYFSSILEKRKEQIDEKRFFLEYLPKDIFEKYDINDKDSLKKFRDACLLFDSPLKLMGGCNLNPDYLEKGIRYSGVQISDPTGEILGIFHILDKKLTYSPIFGYFYEQRDLIKFAHDTYFTTLSFKEIILQQLNLANEFYLHSDDYHTAKEVAKYGPYVIEKISKDEMLDFISDSRKGKEIKRKYLKL